MPSAIRLTIDLDARLQGIDRTIEGLKKVEAGGKSLNQALKTTNIDQMKLALERAYHTDAMFNGEVKASSRYVNNLAKAMKNLETSKGSGKLFSFTGANGAASQTADIKQAYAQFADMSAMVQGNASSATGISKTKAFDLTGYYSDMEKDAKVTGLFNGKLDIANQKMASLQAQMERQTRVNLDLGDLNTMDAKLSSLKVKKASLQGKYAAAKDPASYGGDVVEQTNAQTRYNEEIEKTNSQIAQLENKRQVFTDNANSIDDMGKKWATLNEEQTKMLNHYDSKEFFGDLDKQTEGIRTFGTELQAVQARMSSVKSQGIKLINAGGDQKEIQKLATEYRKLEVQSNKLSKATSGTGKRIGNLIKSFVSAQLVVWLIRSAFSALTRGITDATDAAASAIETANLFNTTFAQVGVNANNVAATMSREFGLAFSTAQKSIGVFGDLAIGFGSSSNEALKFADSATKTVMDLVSFKNITGDMNEILKGFSSGLAGNNKNFKQYGAIVKETSVAHNLAMKGLDKLTGSALELAKMQERLNIVIKQSPNSINDMVKTFNSAQNVQRRYAEGMKQLKENVGTDFLPMFTKMRLAILSHVEAYNLARAARDNYANGTGMKLVDTSTPEGTKKATKAIKEYFSDLLANAPPTLWDSFTKKYTLNLDSVKEATKAFGTSAKVVYDLMGGIKGISEAEITALDLQLDSELAINEAISERKTATSEYLSSLDAVIEKLSEAGGVFANKEINTGIGGTTDKKASPSTRIATISANTIISQMIGDFQKKLPGEFVAGIKSALADVDLATALGNKNKFGSDLYDALNNALITHKVKMNDFQKKSDADAVEGDKALYQQKANEELALMAALSSAQELVVQNYADNLSAITAEGLTTQLSDQSAELTKQLDSVEKKNGFIKQYGTELGSIYSEQYDALQETLAIKEKLVANNVDEKVANDAMLVTNGLINQLYNGRITLAGQTADEAERTANAEKESAEYLRVQNSLRSLSDEKKGVQEENRVARRGLSTPFGENAQQSALRTMNNAKNDAGFSARKQLNSLLADGTRQMVEESMGAFTAEMFLSAREVKSVTDIRTEMEVKAEIEYQKSIKDARDGTVQKIEGLFTGLGDVGMVKGWMDDFKNIKAYGMSEAGGSLSASEAGGKALGGVGMAILGEFLGKLESVNELLSMITNFMDMMAPIVDQFLAPLLVVIGPILEMLGDLLIPILQILFPVLQAFAVVLIYVVAVVQTVVNAFSWLGRCIAVLGWNMTHWFDQKSMPNLADETVAIWNEANADVKKIWEMEIDARVQYVSDLTDAQQGEIDAYKKMYESGLLDLGEYLSLRNDVTGTNQSSEIQRFAKGGNFITSGPQMIMVGDNPGGREHIIIEPVSSKNAFASLGNNRSMSSGGNTYAPVFYITSDNPKAVARSVEDVLATMGRRGESYAS